MTREQITAILTATRTDNITFDDGSSIDWSGHDGHSREIEVVDADGNTAMLNLTHEALAALVNGLAAALLTDS